MGAFSLWHWLIVFVVVGLLLFVRKKPTPEASYAGAAVHVHTPTQYICASLHTGHIDPQATIDRVEDRHKAKLPELGLNMGRILFEARQARRRRAAFSLAALVVTGWLAFALIDHLASFEAMSDDAWIESLATLLIEPLLLMTLIGFIEVIVINRYLKRHILGLTDAPDDDTKQNVVVFGGFSPFAGYGGDLDNWSFTVDASKPANEHAPKPKSFAQVELLDHVSRELEQNVVLGDSQDRLFVNGRRIRGQKLFMFDATSMPNTAISPEVMRTRIGRPDQDARHYRVFSVPFANGHLHLTYFIRATMVGDNLFIECRCFLLSPLKPQYTELNELPVQRGFVYHFSQLWKQFLMSWFTWLRGPALVLFVVARLRHKLSCALFGDPQDKAKKRQETYNYGQSTSLREGWASFLYHTYFQLLDKDMISKTCQHIIINGIVDFLESKGVATDDIKERRTQIFNSGVIVSGGVVNTQQMAVGKGARVKAQISNTLAAGKR